MYGYTLLSVCESVDYLVDPLNVIGVFTSNKYSI